MNIKKLIAREGLIFIGIMLLGILFSFISAQIPYAERKPVGAPVFKDNGPWNQYIVGTKDEKGRPIEKIDGSWYLKDANENNIMKDNFNNFGILTLFFCYPFYLLIRFIFWAIRTLKQKE